MVKVKILNKEDKIEVMVKDDEIIIEGLELKPYWKRVALALCWWKNPTFILRHPKVIYNRNSKGEMVALFG